MAFIVPGLRDIFDDLLRDFGNRFPGANLAKKTVNRALVGTIATATAMILRSVRVIYRDLWPDTAARDALLRHGAIRGVELRAATAARGTDALRIVGTIGSAYTVGDLLTHASGLIFELGESGVIGGSGFADVDVTAVSTGRQTRLAAGEVLTFSSPPAGIQSRAVLVLDLDEDGDDEESEGEYRARVLDRIAFPGMGGNANDFRTWAREVSGVSEAYVYPLRQGLGSVHVAALHGGSGAGRLLSSGDQAELQTYLDTKKPIITADCYVLNVVAEPQAIEVVIEEQDGFPWDWSDAAPLEVATWDPVTRILVFASDRPADMQVGDRLVYKLTSGTLNAGEPIAIEGFSGANAVILATHAELAAAPPVAAALVFAGGALTQAVRDSLQAHVDSLGPGKLVANAGVASIPGGDTSSGGSYWVGSLLRSKLGAAADDVSGVVDYDIVSPAVNYHPTNLPPTLTVGLVTASQIIVRAKH